MALINDLIDVEELKKIIPDPINVSIAISQPTILKFGLMLIVVFTVVALISGAAEKFIFKPPPN
jgi:hypothetical protein